MAYVEHIDNDAHGSNNGAWVILGVVIVLFFLMLMLAWGGVFGTQVQQVIPFYSGQTAPEPAQVVVPGTQGAPGAPGAGGTGGAAGAPGAPGAAGAAGAPAQTPTAAPTTP